jgi:hypothetical protein
MKASMPASSRAAERIDCLSRNSSRVIAGTPNKETWSFRVFQAFVSRPSEERLKAVKASRLMKIEATSNDNAKNIMIITVFDVFFLVCCFIVAKSDGSSGSSTPFSSAGRIMVKRGMICSCESHGELRSSAVST